ncbi:MAG TPA: hypothetical protein VH722_05570 [Alphaproteobacteria bacterium]|jgi:hypothetical protein|nr:hypothetical protein [Alphaproteobacteria bacterium]
MSYTSNGSLIPRGTAAFVALAALLATAAPAMAVQTSGACIDATEIDHTHVLNNRQVLFYMKDRKVWLNTLNNICTTLPYQEAFVLPTGFSTFCSNAQAITVLNTRQVCQLGEFTPYQKVPGRS